MAEFLKSYGIWIVLGLLLLVMLVRSRRGHGAGGCGGDHHDSAPNPGSDKEKPKHGCC